MNSSQKLGIVILAVITFVYVYVAFFAKDFKMPEFNWQREEHEQFNPVQNNEEEMQTEEPTESVASKTVKIYILDKSGKLRSVNRTCNTNEQKSCFEFAIKELINSPTNWEKSKGFTSEIPAGTKILSIRESNGNTKIDLSQNFEAGGGAESTYTRMEQLIKTANANTSSPVYLYINGKQANVIGGEGLMIKQPLNERSLDE